MYNINLLNDMCKVNNIILINNYDNMKITRDTRIIGKCNYCLDNIFDKSFHDLYNYKNFGCKKCAQIIGTKNRKSYYLNNYGVESPLQVPSIMKKLKNTNLNKYGFENIFQSKEIQNRIIEKNIEKYGVKYNIQRDDIKIKIKESIINKYGVDHPSKSEEIKNRKKLTCLKNYGVEYSSQSEEIKNKIKITCLKNYGVEYPSQSEEIKNKIKITCLKKYGVDHPQKSEIIREKTKATNIIKYGVEYPLVLNEIKYKIKQTNLRKYGIEYPMQLKIFQQKAINTNLIKYGVEYPFQNSEFLDIYCKKAYKFKDYILPSGKIITYQGYENYGLTELLNIEKLDENDIVTGVKNVPIIWYSDENNKSHRHYVDIYIPKQNKCIEIKSSWTMLKKYDNILLKQNSAKKLNYNYEIWIYSKKVNILNKIV